MPKKKTLEAVEVATEVSADEVDDQNNLGQTTVVFVTLASTPLFT